MRLPTVKLNQLHSRFPALSGYVAILLLALAIAHTSFGNGINMFLLDAGFRSMQKSGAPASYDTAPVLIGLDEATSTALPEPTSLWHHHLAKLFAAVAEAKPAVVGLQLPLPIRSYAFIAPEYDKAMADGLRKLTASVPVVIGQSVGSTGRTRKVYAELLNAAGNPPLAVTSVCADDDDVVRRFDYSLCPELAPLFKQADARPLAVVMAEKLGKHPRADGLIDFGSGGVVRYLSMIDILNDIDKGQSAKLKQAIAGRPVLIGTLLPTETRFALPVALAGWEPGNTNLPTTLVQFQALRSLLGAGMIQQLPGSAFLIAAACLFWFRRNGFAKFFLFLACAGLTLFIAWHLLQRGSYLPAGILLFSAGFAYLCRLIFDYALHRREKTLLHSAFAGYVSPRVMREITRSGLASEQILGSHQATLLYADIRDFGARCAALPAERVFDLLNRYFSAAVAAIHARGGAVDRFVGDALMASFGVPHASAQAERNALEAAQDILLRLQQLNAELKSEGLPPLAIGIGLHSGTVAAGYIGSRGRNDYTLLGNAIGIAARLEAFARTSEYPVVCSHAVARQVAGMGGLIDLGEQSLADGQTLHLWGWRPAALEKSA